ncbi:hypothetical protein QWY87_10200 [Lutimonas halocynthiae]|nr:hypothetical protein [Lutimonas halocynthiae]MDN3643074.1 hypothetical protein [Lutimonas halocynthiae]
MLATEHSLKTYSDEPDTGDSGFYAGLGAGFTINISELVFINMEYE